MKVVISGGTGLIGTAIARSLRERAEIIVLSRRPDSVETGRAVRWDPSAAGAWTAEIADADVVINLAGAGIADKRWTEKRKRELWNSRIDSTRSLVDALGKRSSGGRPVLVSASAIGYYGARGDEELDEASTPGEGFLTDLSIAWEAEALRASEVARVVLPRIGIVLSRDGGALAAMLPIFRLGLGGRLGDGAQWMSWIHIDDVVGMIETAIADDRWEGAFNAVAPSPATNAEFTKALGRALRRPTVLPAPGFAVRAALGRMAEALLLSGQRVLPTRADELGYEFRYRSLDDALATLGLTG
jgi:uncharacterized protein (TIGR01777 family)